MTPKGLLRLKEASSTLADLAERRFEPVLDDPTADREQVRRLVIVSGKLYYDIAGHEERAAATSIAVARVEQLYPFPAEAIRRQLDAYPNAQRRLWVQEEPENMGAWRYLALKAEQELGVRLEPVCREEGAAPAAGSPTLHQQEQQELLDRAFAGL
jgi:2-oxoglutarate dehydrogenase E1 component